MTRRRFSNGVGAALFVIGALVGLWVEAPVDAQMPDPKQMSGVPLPVTDLQPGTVMVRVIRGALSNIVTGHPVELIVGERQLTAKTNDAGRAEFTGLKPGTRVKAVTTVDGERIESHEFEVPSTGGIRLMLVASDPNPAKSPGTSTESVPVQPGLVVLGDQSRFVFEIGDEGLTVFAILQILNNGQAPVQPPQPWCSTCQTTPKAQECSRAPRRRPRSRAAA
jgi:hypothetical protein